VNQRATDDEIKKAYRKLALKFHPDKNQAPQAEEAFKKVAQAYDCLSNKEKRAFYDRHGGQDPDEHVRAYQTRYSQGFASPEVHFWPIVQTKVGYFQHVFLSDGDGPPLCVKQWPPSTP
jgi:DnaJ-class molecular chaperone